MTTNATRFGLGGVAAVGVLALLTACGAAPSSSPVELRLGHEGRRRSTCPAWSPTAADSTTSRSTSSATRACSRRRRRSASSYKTVESKHRRTTTRRTSTSLVDAEVQPDRHRRLRPRATAHGARPRKANPDIDFADRSTTNDDSSAPEHQADHLRHRPGGVPRRLRGRQLLEDRHRRHLRRHADPDRSPSSWTASPTASKYYNKQKGKNVKVLGWDVQARTAPSPAASTPTRPRRTRPRAPRPGRRRDHARRRPDLPGRRARRSRTPASTIALIGVDADVFSTDPSVKDLLLTSVMKGIDVGRRTPSSTQAAKRQRSTTRRTSAR